MHLLLKNITVVDERSSFDGRIVDIYIKEGIIEDIGFHLEVPASCFVFEYENAHVSTGWMDIGAFVGDPGLEYREDLGTIAAAAAAGGFSALAVLPNTEPCIQTKGTVQYIKNQSNSQLVKVLPIGAVTEGCKGKDITEMNDMYLAGAVAFSDGLNAIQNSGMMMRALQYVKAFDGIVLNHPHDKDTAFGGQMHEDLTSTTMGVKGMPTMSEELMVQRDLYLLEYTESKLHILNISTKGSVDLIRRAKAKGLAVTCSVPALNLLRTDEDLSTFDTHLKVMPPLRSASDRDALIEGLVDGTIDCITANHIPHDEDHKKLEFFYADFGAIGLETVFAAAHTALKNEMEIGDLMKKMSLAPRKALGLPVSSIEKGRSANLSIFDPIGKWTFQLEDIHSKSKNSPFIGETFSGKVLGVVNNRKYSFNV